MTISVAKQQKLFGKAVKKHKAGKYSEATALYKKILKDAHNHIDSNCMLGTLYAELGKPELALEYLRHADSLNNASYLIKNNLGNVYRMTGDYEQARSYYQQAIDLAPDNVEAYNNLAIICKRMQNVSAAIDLYRKAIQLHPQFLEAHYNLGKLYSDANDNTNAYACYQRVVEINPAYSPVYNQLGDCYRADHLPEKAEQCYRRYLELSDTDRDGVKLKLAQFEHGEIPDRSPADLVIQSYEGKAQTWDQDVNRATMEFQGPQIIRDELNALYTSEGGSTNLQILDLGCGTGLCGVYLKPMASRLDGVDLSAHMLRQAKQKDIYDNLYRADIEEFLSGRDAGYDLITASGVVIFFGKLKNIHKHIQHCLNNNGLFVYTCYISAGDDIEVRNNLHFAHSEPYLRECAQQAGLQVVSLREIIHEYDFGEPQKGFVVTLKKP